MRPEDIQVQCDFDGTITMDDVMVGLNDRFSDESWTKIVEQWDRKELTAREALSRMYNMIRASKEEVDHFIQSWVRIRDGFTDLLAWCHEKGMTFLIVSEGLDHVISRTLEMLGVEAEVLTNHAIFGGEFLSVSFPETPPVCDHDDGDICGTCKVAQVRKAKAEGKFVVYIGDGTTDVRPAMEADLVFARRALAKRLPARGKGFVPFEDFYEVRKGMEALLE